MTMLAAMALGVVSSAHCVGMCGPLVLLFGGGPDPTMSVRVQRAALYHSGRIATYMVLGLAAGLLGHVSMMAGTGRFVALAGGVALIAAAAAPLLGRRDWIGVRLMPVAARASASARAWQARHPITGPVALGMANGILPCGMVYAALALALGAGSAVQGAAAMAAFGLGTVPALVATTVMATALPAQWRSRVTAAAPVALVAVGVLLVVCSFTPYCH